MSPGGVASTDPARATGATAAPRLPVPGCSGSAGLRTAVTEPRQGEVPPIPGGPRGVDAFDPWDSPFPGPGTSLPVRSGPPSPRRHSSRPERGSPIHDSEQPPPDLRHPVHGDPRGALLRRPSLDLARPRGGLLPLASLTSVGPQGQERLLGAHPRPPVLRDRHHRGGGHGSHEGEDERREGRGAPLHLPLQGEGEGRQDGVLSDGPRKRGARKPQPVDPPGLERDALRTRPSSLPQRAEDRPGGGRATQPRGSTTRRRTGPTPSRTTSSSSSRSSGGSTGPEASFWSARSPSSPFPSSCWASSEPSSGISSPRGNRGPPGGTDGRSSCSAPCCSWAWEPAPPTGTRRSSSTNGPSATTPPTRAGRRRRPPLRRAAFAG